MPAEVCRRWVNRTCEEEASAVATAATRCSCASARSISSNSVSCDASTACRSSQFSLVGDGIPPPHPPVALLALGVAMSSRCYL